MKEVIYKKTNIMKIEEKPISNIKENEVLKATDKQEDNIIRAIINF